MILNPYLFENTQQYIPKYFDYAQFCLISLVLLGICRGELHLQWSPMTAVPVLDLF